MRFRIGLLQDTREIEKQIAKDAAEAQKPPTVKTEAETKRDELRAKDPDKDKTKAKRPKIKPLPEAKAIELGANFVSETFLLAVGIALILFENARRGRQETKKDESIVQELEEIKKWRRSLPKEIKKLSEEENEEIATENGPSANRWLSWIPNLWPTDDKGSTEPKELAIVNTTKSEKEAKPADPVPALSTSVFTKILPRTHPRDVNPKTTDHPTD